MLLYMPIALAAVPVYSVLLLFFFFKSKMSKNNYVFKSIEAIRKKLGDSEE